MTHSHTSNDNDEDIENTKEAMMVLNDKIEKDFEGNYALQAFADYKDRQSQVVSFIVSEQALFEVQIDTDTKKMIPNSKSSSEQYADRYDARVIVLICVWYFFSACTLYLNKYLVAFENADSATLSSCQMLMTMFLGFFQQRHSLGTYAERDL